MCVEVSVSFSGKQFEKRMFSSFQLCTVWFYIKQHMGKICLKNYYSSGLVLEL